jgi:ABC-type uncharacterized transport system involved in gliding motility auxiliary subunit
MDKIKARLNYIGLALVFAALVILKIRPEQKAVALTAALAGLAALIVYIILNLSSLKRGFKRKSFIYSSNLLLIIVLVLGILVLANIFLAKHHLRVDFTSSKLHSLSDQSIKVVKNLKKDVSVKAFFREGNMSRASMDALMKIYSYESPRIKIEFIDPDKNPGLVKRYDVTQDGTTIFEAGDKESRITTTSEEDITNAFVKISRDRKKIIYFLEGHGEGAIEESGDDGYSIAKGELEKLGYEVKKLSLALAGTFPSDCALLIVPGPKKTLLPEEIATIRDYLHRGGRVFFMIDPETETGLAPLLAECGIKIENDLIVDRVSRLLGGDYFMPVVTAYEDHAITRKFRYATFFPLARSIEPAETKPDGVTVTPIAKTSPNSWAERDLGNKEVSFDKGKDRQGPICLAVVATLKAPDKALTQTPASRPESGKTETENARVAVYGDSDIAANKYYGLSGNGNFFLNTVNWLTEEADLISIQPKTSSPRSIQLTQTQGRFLFFVSVIFLPLVVLVAGIAIWIRRRSL